jgi:hypothetical protein
MLRPGGLNPAGPDLPRRDELLDKTAGSRGRPGKPRFLASDLTPRTGDNRSSKMHGLRITIDVSQLAEESVERIRRELPTAIAKAAASYELIFPDTDEYTGGILQIYLKTTDAAVAHPWLLSFLKGGPLSGIELCEISSVASSGRPRSEGAEFGTPWPVATWPIRYGQRSPR